MTDNLNLVGRWDIVSWEQRYDDGRLVLPMGERLEGFLLYSPEGSMTCLIARSERPKFPSGLQWEATEAEKAQAYEGILSYGGTYKVLGDTVEHHVSVSAFPNWVGGVQKRKFELAGTALSITARMEEGTPQARTAALTWRRGLGRTPE